MGSRDLQHTTLCVSGLLPSLTFFLGYLLILSERDLPLPLTSLNMYDGRLPCEPITFLTVPKPQRKKLQVRRSIIVLSNWLAFPNSKVVMMTDPATYDPTGAVLPVLEQMFGPRIRRIVFAGELPAGYSERPIVREWFRVGQAVVRSGYLCFLNGDIIVSRKWMKTAMRVFTGLKDKERVLVFGTRTDVRQWRGFYNIDVQSPTFVSDLENYCESNRMFDNFWGMDLFMIHSSMPAWNVSDIPEYVIGLCVWDNWFMSWATRNFETVTMNFNPMLCHVNHERNACNGTNFEYFGNITNNWHLKLRLHRHYRARWMVDYNKSVLVSRYHRRVVRLPPPDCALSSGKYKL